METKLSGVAEQGYTMLCRIFRRIQMHKKTNLKAFCFTLGFTSLITFASLPLEAVTYVDFEQFPSDTLLRDQLNYLGLNVIGVGGFSGLVLSEGMYGVKNFNNSPTQILDIGMRNQPTTMEFVHPNDPNIIIGANSVSLLMGDGDSDSEHFQVTWYDTNGVQLAQQDYTTQAEGIFIQVSEDDLGALIGSVELNVFLDSASGVTCDDLTFQLTIDPYVCINRPRSDLDGDCRVTFTDFAIMASEWLDYGLQLAG
ncbi:MAG: hypothetical protein ACYS67_14135 [Planctomycetota bacterium]|jgi:hypothetical protein